MTEVQFKKHFCQSEIPFGTPNKSKTNRILRSKSNTELTMRSQFSKVSKHIQTFNCEFKSPHWKPEIHLSTTLNVDLRMAIILFYFLHLNLLLITGTKQFSSCGTTLGFRGCTYFRVPTLQDHEQKNFAKHMLSSKGHVFKSAYLLSVTSL